jgi:hypothetical protein
MHPYALALAQPRCPETQTAFSLASEPMSAIAAVGAGFVLAAIIQLLGQRRREELLGKGGQKPDTKSTILAAILFSNQEQRERLRRLRRELAEVNRRRESNRSTALTLLYSTLITLALDGFLFALISGQESCIKANTEAMVANGVLAVGATSFFCAMAWLLNIYENQDDGLARLSRGVGYFFPMAAVFLLGITATALVSDYYALYDETDRRAPLPFRYIWLYIPLAMGSFTIWKFRCSRRGNRGHEKAALWASRLAVAYAVFSLVNLGAAAAIPAPLWGHVIVEWSFLIFFVTLPIVAPIVIMFILLAAMPAGKTRGASAGPPGHS